MTQTDIIDITFDLETADTAVTAAPLQLAAVAWLRNAELSYQTGGRRDPFLRQKDIYNDNENENENGEALVAYSRHCDLTAAWMDGLTVSSDTQQWWSRQKDEVRRAVTGDPRSRLTPEELWQTFFAWTEAVRERTGARHLVLWCQGQDFDIAMMRYQAHRYGLRLPVSQYSLRDCRTLALELALLFDRTPHADAPSRTPRPLTPDELFSAPSREPYRHLPPLPATALAAAAPFAAADTLQPHEPLYDALRSSWSTWHAIQELRLMVNG